MDGTEYRLAQHCSSCALQRREIENPQLGVLQAGEAGVLRIFGGGGGTHGHRPDGAAGKQCVVRFWPVARATPGGKG